MSRCAQDEAACLVLGGHHHQHDEGRRQLAAKAPTPRATRWTDPGAPGLLLCRDACPGCRHWPTAETGSKELGWGQAMWEKLQGRRASRAGALLFPRMGCRSTEWHKRSSKCSINVSLKKSISAPFQATWSLLTRGLLVPVLQLTCCVALGNSAHLSAY